MDTVTAVAARSMQAPKHNIAALSSVQQSADMHMVIPWYNS